MEDNLKDTLLKIKGKQDEINKSEIEANGDYIFYLLSNQMYTLQGKEKSIPLTFTFNYSLFRQENSTILPIKTPTWKWEFEMEEYAGKSLSMLYSEEDFNSKLYSSSVNLFDIYRNKFIPNLLKYALFNVPSRGGEYQDDFGLLRDTKVEVDRLNYDPEFFVKHPKDGDPHSLVRNHYRASIYPNMGFTPEDITFCTTYLKKYIRNEKSTIVAIASPSAFESIKKITPNDGWSSALNIQDTDIYKATEGVIPEGYVVFIAIDDWGTQKIDYNDSTLLKIENSDLSKRGISLKYPDKDIEELEEEDFKHPTIDIGSIGYYLIGREKMLILDTNSRKNNPDYNSLDTLDNGRWFCSVMTSEGLEELQEFADNCNPKFVQ